MTERATITRTDVETLESLSDAAMRAGLTEIAVSGYVLALRLRTECGWAAIEERPSNVVELSTRTYRDYTGPGQRIVTYFDEKERR